MARRPFPRFPPRFPCYLATGLVLLSMSACSGDLEVANQLTPPDLANLPTITVPDTVVVRFVEAAFPLEVAPTANGHVSVGEASLDDLFATFGVVSLEPQFPGAGVLRPDPRDLAHVYKAVFDASHGTDDLRAALLAEPLVEDCQKISIKPAYQWFPDDPYLDTQWALHNTGQDGGTADADVDAPEAWAIESSEDGALLAILDSGVDLSHPDLAANIRTDLGWDFVDDVTLTPPLYTIPGEDYDVPDATPQDFNGHGTHVAGIAAAISDNATGVTGIDRHGEIMPVRMMFAADYCPYGPQYGCDEYGLLRMDTAAEAVYHATNNGADVINCSWGSADDGGLGDAVDDAIDAGVIVVVAAGNSGADAPDYLSTRGDCIDVGSTDHDDFKASSSNYGSWVDVMAPGDSILSTYYDGETGISTYGTGGGTSMAAPLVTGMVGVLRREAPDLTATEIIDVITGTADDIDAINPGFEGMLGAGRVNLYEALRSQTCTDDDGDGWTTCDGDCDDGDEDVNPDATEVACDQVDNDCDGVLHPEETDDDGDGMDECEGDCDDDDATIYLEAPELCDGVDNDCDGDLADEDDDADADGYSECEGDCDDDDALVNPDAQEVACDDVDNDCDGDLHPEEADDDLDGFSECDGDCDDIYSSINPYATDIVGDGVDQNCDEVDGTDTDGDGYASEPSGGEDCDDGDAALNLDDADADGWASCDGDCDDGDDSIHPDAEEICDDGVDSDCLDDLDDTEVDDDGDGYSECGGDCDDGDDDVHPDATEVTCNGHDDDCDGLGEWWVPGDFPAIQEAIDGSIDGEMVCVEAGTYEERIDFDGKEIHVLGVDGHDVTFIDGNQGGSVVTFAGGEGSSALFEGFTVSNGYADEGGGLYLSASSPTLRDLTITDNQGVTYGGGVFVRDGSPTLDGLVVADNAQIGAYSGHDGCGGGGMAFMDDSAGTITNVGLVDNSANCHGGGIYVRYSAPDVDGLRAVSNVAHQLGAGIYVGNGSPHLANIVSIGNSGATVGGGIRLYSSSSTLVNAVVVGNSAGGDDPPPGAGIAISGGSPALSNVTVANNATSENYDWYVGGITGTPATLDHCNVWNNSPSDFDAGYDPIGVDGNISEDPQFLDVTAPDPLDWDLHLATTSPLIDAGDPAVLDPDGSPSDIGAYGGPGAASWDLDRDGYFEWWLPGAYDPLTSPNMDCDDLDETVYPGAGC